MRLLFLPIVVLIAAFSIACGSGTEYSNVKVESAGKSENKNGVYRTLPPADNGDQTQPSGEQTANQPVQSTPSTTDPLPQLPPPAPAQIVTPSFIDSKNGDVKDLPNYPSAQRTNVQMGPMEDVSTALFVLETKDQVEPVAKFYDQIAKSQGWQVITRILETDHYTIELQKGELHEGKVQVRRDPQTNKTTIVISRIEKKPQPKQ